MILPVWRTDEADFEARFAALLEKLSLEEGLRATADRAAEPPLEAVRRIIADVRERGDAALIEYAERFDGCALTPKRLRVSDAEIAEALDRCPAKLAEALQLAAARVEAFQEFILFKDPDPLRIGGRSCAIRYRPVDSAGIYVPGGAASLASSVIMAAVPARVAGVPRLVMATPPREDGTVSDDRLAAARIAGVDEVYRLGGAVAVAALAYGTESVPRVDFVAGPGSVYAMLAKKEVFGQVGIEMLPGPSEIVIMADSSADPRFVAADMLGQAEHDPGSAVLLTDNAELGERTLAALEEALTTLPRADAARACLERYGAVIVARSLSECVELVNRLAPEHLEIMTGAPDDLAEEVRHAGAIFLGGWTPEPTGDYVAGPSHILPTSRTARFCSGLSCNDFLKRSSVIRYDRAALAEDAAPITAIARAEDLEGHARSVEARLEERFEEP
jgi:histidinol dehydrogenase